jgi:cytochrome c
MISGEANLQFRYLTCVVLALAIAAGLHARTFPASADETIDLAAASKQFLNSCGVCHTVEPKAEIRQGPNLATVYGRKAGTLSEFPTYSAALKKAGEGGLVWNDETLDKWITSAIDFVPGAMMPYAQPDPAKRKLVIAYLKSLTGGGAPAK